MLIRKRKIKGSEQFYLVHSVRIGPKVMKKELYLGSKIPDNIEELKKEFQQNIIKEQYLDKLDYIQKNFSKEFESMPPSTKEKYLNYFMIKFTYDTNRIEGSTITLKETAKILEKGITPKNRPIEDVRETEAHQKVFYEMINYNKDLSLAIILKWHKMLLGETHQDIAGKVRQFQVKVAGSKVQFPYTVEIDLLLREFIDWYHKNKNTLHPVKLAAIVHLRFVSIHPFGDGNGRMSRLLMNFILHRNNYPMLNIKYSNRDSYYNSLEKAQVKHDENIFVTHIYRRYLKEYNDYMIKPDFDT